MISAEKLFEVPIPFSGKARIGIGVAQQRTGVQRFQRFAYSASIEQSIQSASELGSGIGWSC
jgi:hypothetical protein